MSEGRATAMSSRGIDPVGSLAMLATAANFVAVPLIIRSLTGYVDTWVQNALRYVVAFAVWAPYLLARAPVRAGDGAIGLVARPGGCSSLVHFSSLVRRRCATSGC